MKRTLFLKAFIALCFIFICQSISAQYCTNSSTKTRSDRYHPSFTLSDDSNSTVVTVGQSATNSAQPVYYDKTATIFTTSPGASINISSNWAGSWMHGYLYIDFNGDGTFTPDINSDGTVSDESELRGYSAYNGITGGFLNHVGDVVTGEYTPRQMKPVIIPTGTPAGTYRARFNVDWNCIDPCGDSAIGNNGGSITDFTITVLEPTPERTITLKVAATGGGEVSGGGTSKGAITCTATAHEGYVFEKWINEEDNEVVSTSTVFSDNTPGNKTYVASFIKPATAPTTYLTFNGNQYARITNNADIRKTASEDYAIAFWVRTRNFSANQNNRAIGFRNGNSPSGYELYSYRKGYGVIAPQTSSTLIFDDAFYSVNNKWEHIVIVFDKEATNNYYYVNGEKIFSSKANLSTSTISQTLDLLLGAGWSSGVPSNFFTGDLSNVRIYKKALTPVEVVADGNNSYEYLPQGLKDVCTAAFELNPNYTTSTLPDLTGRGNIATLVNFPTPTTDGTIYSTELYQNNHLTGRGNENDYIIHATVTFTGPETDLLSAKISLNGTTDLKDLNKVKIYSTGLFSDFDERTAADATLLGEFTPAEGEIICDLTNGKLSQGVNHLWIVADVAMDAKEGNLIDATLNSLTTANQTFAITNNNPNGSREIILVRKLLYAPGDKGVSGYRIPAMDILPNGDIVTAIDQRYTGEDDLPAKISLLSIRSEDGGYTWKDEAILAPYASEVDGRGDVALVTADNGDIIAAFVGDRGLFSSSEGNPISSYISRSADGGKSWSPVVKGGEGDITKLLWGSECGGDAFRLSSRAAFFGSGRGTMLKRQTGDNAWKNGRIMFVSAIYNGSFASYIVYSDDHGETWKVSSQAFYGADESKVTELSDGTVVISVRRNGARGYNHSSDGGETWGTQGTWSDLVTNAVNGDILEYTALSDGYEKNRTLHSLTINDGGKIREKVSMYLSYDEGATWTREKQLFPGNSGYSTMIKLHDGTIAVYAEDQYDNVSNYFMRFSLEWMTSGADSYQPIPSRTISLTSNIEGAGTLTGGGTAEGAMICTATPNSGFEFINWTNQETGAHLSASPTYCENIAGDKTIVANFKRTTASRSITLETNPSDAGIVSGGGIAEGPITCSVTPNDGFIFLNWTEKISGEIVATTETFIDDTSGDKTYVANFIGIATAPSTYITFNGTSQCITALTSQDIEKAAGEHYTLSLWVKSPLTEHSRPISYRVYGSTTSFIDMFTNASGYAMMMNSGGTNKIMDDFMPGTNTKANQWVHFAFVVDANATGICYYVNGTKGTIARGNTSLPIANTGKLVIGAQTNYDATTEAYRFFLNGSVANVRIYKKALSDLEVIFDGASDYEDLPETIKDACVLSYKMDNNDLKLTLPDQTGRGNDGTLHGFDIETSIAQASNNSSVYAIITGDEIVIMGTNADEFIKVYSATGELLQTVATHDSQTKLNIKQTGVFILKTNNDVIKIVK